MPSFSSVSAQRLATCDPRIQEILNEVIKHVDFTVLEGHRDEAAQNKAFAEGKSKLQWPHGKHNSSPSRAVDIAPWFTSQGENIDWKDMAAFGRLMGFVQRVGEEKGVKLRFGLDWNQNMRTRDESFVDAPHFELIEP